MEYISSLALKNPDFPRKLVILGSTGSIGQSTLKVIAKHQEKFSLLALAGARNIELLLEQALCYRPKYLGVLTKELAQKLKKLLPSDYHPQILWGEQGYLDLAQLEEADFVLSALVGAAGLGPTLKAVEKGKSVLIANKESLVLAGELIRKLAKKQKSVILPLDSEHNAIFQATQPHFEQVKKIILTASGGPFWNSRLDFKEITPKQALKHPNWSMGAKISIDSATLMNKGLEVIEAHHLFGLELSSIEVVIHPQSLIHSLVLFQDGSHLAQLGFPDMQIPISYALGYPRRLELTEQCNLDLTKFSPLTFYPPDLEKFPCLRLAQEALQAGQSHCVVLNAANEIAVELFLKEKINFQHIPLLIEELLAKHQSMPISSFETILNLDQETRIKTLERAKELKC